LLWRFRAAPYERWITVYGALASTWPVDTGVLVESGKVYAASGIMDNDGTHVYCLHATNGAIIWQNNDSAFVNTNSHKGIGAQGFLTTAKGKLWMPGGAVCSPASYDLATGACTPAEYGFKRALRGREIGAFADDMVVFGGYMQYGKPNDWYGVKGESIGFLTLSNNGAHAYNEVSVGSTTVDNLLMPAWRDDRTLACVDAADGLSCWNTTQMVARIKAARGNAAETQYDGRKAVFLSETGNPAKLWQTSNIPMFGIAMGSDAGLLLRGNVPAYGKKPSSFWLSAISLNTNTLLWSKMLPSEPVIGGLSVDKEGTVFVPLVNGQIVAYADPLDIPMIQVSQDPFYVNESGTNSLEVWLSKDPGASVTVQMARASGDEDVQVLGAGQLVFDSSNWTNHQSVLVRAVEDDDMNASSALITLSSTALATYELTATENDNDLILIDFGSKNLTTNTG
jgi:hypothetical protein